MLISAKQPILLQSAVFSKASRQNQGVTSSFEELQKLKWIVADQMPNIFGA